MKYLKVWANFIEVLEPYSTAEIGQLFLDMLHYAGTGEEPSEFVGNERFAWAFAKREIDNAWKESQKNARNGSKGGRPEKQDKPTETENNPNKPTETDENQQEPTESLKEKKRKEKKGNEKKGNISLLSDDDAAAIAGEQSEVLDAAQRAGFGKSQAVFDRLVSMYATHGKDKVIAGIESCVIHNAVSLAYLEAVLSGKPRKENRQAKKVAAQDYEQRDYSDVQKKLEEEQRRRFEQRLTKGVPM